MMAMQGTPRSYAKGVFVGFDVLVNAILGGRPYQTLSCHVGESIMDNGWAARVRGPALGSPTSCTPFTKRLSSSSHAC